MRKAQADSGTGVNPEWCAAKACEYWPDQRGHWAPVSWKDHLYDFAVFFDGTIASNPVGTGYNRVVSSEAQAFAAELSVFVCAEEWATPEACGHRLKHRRNPDGMQVASWEPTPAPVYVIEHGIDYVPVLVKQRQFAHVPGGKPVARGDEPLFLWVRFEVSDVVEVINHAKHICIVLTLAGPTARPDMYAFNNVNFGAWPSSYPLGLIVEGPEDLSKPVYWVHWPRSEPGKNIRAAIPGRQEAQLRVHNSRAVGAFNMAVRHAILMLPTRVGAQVDLLFPAVPMDENSIQKEMKLGFDGALREANRFWAGELATRTFVRVSEPLVQGWVDQLPRLQAMIAQKDPASGEYSLVTGSYAYEAIWATPLALEACAMDFRGLGQEVAKYLDPFRIHQGATKPPSPYLKEHPGYLGTPKRYTAIDWLSDHGAILWAVANHGLLFMDRTFLGRWKPAIVKACEFIADARGTKGHKGYPGILPPGVANDCKTASQCCWNDAWNHKALKTAATLLLQVGHPRGKDFLKEARAYREAFQKAYREVISKAKKWRAADGAMVPFTPPTLSEAKGYEAAHPFHLDTGACALVFGELFPAGDPIMQASLRWLRQGPQTRLYRKFASPFQAPRLDHEISSCEPCYSWNLFHTFELGDRERFAMGLYGLFAAGGSRQNFVACETREGVFGNCGVHGLALMLLRMAVVWEEGQDLHLLKTAPLAFFRDGGLDWKNAPTWFGEVSLAARFDERRRTLHLHYRPPTRQRPRKTLLHLPPFEPLSAVVLNRKPFAAHGACIELE